MIHTTGPHRSQRLTIALLSVFLGLALAAAACAQRPNVLLVMVDDMGFSDLGCYGSEIETPTLDRLAAGGLRFTQFYNTAKCHSSRVALLSGQYCMQAGDTALTHCVTSAEVLAEAGYFTMMTGKWHLKKQPTDFGFQRYFGHLSGACNYYKGDNTFRLNGEKWPVPETGFYTTVANVDYAIQFLAEARKTGKPWFCYIAFNAPHAPLQPLKEDYEKYLGRYREGWDVVRAARVAKQNELGLFGEAIQASPRPAHVRAWDKLDADWQAFEEMRMTAYAGMIDRIDQEMGRLVANLEKAGELDHTLILFISDNGACPYDRNRGARNLQQKPYDPNIRWADSTGWAWARNTPFRFYKQNQFEGGIATAAIVHWPAGLKTRPGAFVHDPAHLIDVLPTLADVCGAPVPTEWPGRQLRPVSGISLTPVFAGKSLGQRPLHFLFSQDRGLRDGDWKLVSYRRQPWQLFNIAADRAENHDLAAQHPERVTRMIEQWHDMAEHVLRAPADVRGPVMDQAAGALPHEYSNFDLPYNAAAPRKRK